MPKYNPKAIANFFVRKARAENKNLTPMQIQKLIFFSHGINLAVFKDLLVSEDFEAWEYGPVLPSLYYETKLYGASPVHSELTDINLKSWDIFSPYIDENDENTKKVLDFIWENYAQYSGIQLSHITHMEGTPWSQTYEKCVRGKKISNDLIRDYYEKRIE